MKRIKNFFNKNISVGSAFILMLITGVAVCVCSCISFFLVFKNNQNTNTSFSKLAEAASIMASRYVGEVDEDKMTDAAIDAMIDSLGDRWSYYTSLDDLQSYQTSSTNSYVGVGITVYETDGKGLFISQVADEGSAKESGITAGVYITAVDGTSIIDMPLADATSLIKGEEGTTVILTVTDENGVFADHTVTRRKLDIDPVSGELIGETGYITLLNFNASSAESFIEKIEMLSQQGATNFIFDVRFNGGGRVSELCKMLDYLLPKCTIFVTDDKNGNREITESDAECFTAPAVVLVNDSSYSAAEYFAATLQEYGYAKVIGTQTSGKGFSQTPITLSDGSVISLSTMTYYTPSGLSLEGVGITPDHILEVSGAEYFALYSGSLEHENDSQLQLALDVLNSK